MASSDSSSNPALEILAQCDFFCCESDLKRLKAISDSMFALEFGSENSVFDRQSVFVASSRLPQKLDEIPEFFDGVLKLAMNLDGDSEVLLTANGTACDAMVRRVGQLFRTEVVEVRMAPLDPKKLNAVVSSLEGSKVVFVFDFENRGVDFALASLASQMTALSVRKGGNLHSALLHRLKDGKPARVLVESTLTKKKLTEELLSAGATGWVLLDAAETESVEPDSGVAVLNQFDASDFLLHWTRRRVGPWPDQTEIDFLDDLLFRSSRKDHREVASLKRILATQRILAGSVLTRDPRPVVCFSDVTFEELGQLRTFRPHLSRWDFEPFGVAIRKSWLQEKGAAAVVYGDESTWESLPDEKRAFFQLNDPNGKIDWSAEREWRIVGDVDLRAVPMDAAVVFVRTVADAAEVNGFCRWPIVVLGD